MNIHCKSNRNLRAFANAVDDFKQYDFDVTKILTEYRHFNLLRDEIELTQNQVYNNTATRDTLIKEISSLKERGRLSQANNQYF